jgi:HlyD family secretion protein
MRPGASVVLIRLLQRAQRLAPPCHRQSVHAAQIHSNTRRELANEWVEALSQYEKLKQELTKQTQKQSLLELKAPQAGTIKDLATHTVGAVLQPGSVLMTLVPSEEILRAEVWVGNDDIGFVREGQHVQLKVAPYPFQKYGMVQGTVTHVSADATEPNQTPASASKPEETVNLATPNANTPQPYRYKAIVALNAQQLEREGTPHSLNVGMQVNAEIILGKRTVMAYVLSPVQGAMQEAARER